MSAEYDRRQRPGNWPERWTPEGLPDWYVGMLVGLAGNLTAWRGRHDPCRHLDPRRDPRCPRGQHAKRGHHASGH
jgi:hypothetical protein